MAEQGKETTKRLSVIAGSSTMGAEVMMSNVVTEISSGRELSEIYLKPSNNESSDDEDNEGVPVSNADTEKEEDDFNQFVKQQREKQQKKIKLSSVVNKP